MPFIPYAVVEEGPPNPALPVSVGLVGWWDPSDPAAITYPAGYAKGPNIATLIDKSGTANTLIAQNRYASAGIPTGVQTNRAMIAMMETAQYGDLPSSFNDNSSTFFAVVAPAYINANQPIFGPGAINGLVHYFEITTGFFTTAPSATLASARTPPRSHQAYPSSFLQHSLRRHVVPT